MTKEQIMEKLQKHWDYVANFYNEDQFLGIFLYGSQNYGTDTEDSDVDSKVIILPTFEKFCLSPGLISKEYKNELNEHIEVKDIRLMREMYMKQNLNYVETLFTDYCILNPRYSGLFKTYFIANREEIAHMNRAKAVISSASQAVHTLQQNPRDNKKLYNAWRMYYFLEKYVAGAPYVECMRPEGEEHDFLMSLRNKTNEMFKSDYKLDYNATEVVFKIKQLVNKYKDIDSPDAKTASTALNDGVVKILEESFKEKLDKPKIVNKREFFNNLTNMEQKAYYALLAEVGAEGNLSVKQISIDSVISRPVYTSLFIKLKESNIAEIINQGVKGTYVKFIHPEIRLDAINAKGKRL